MIVGSYTTGTQKLNYRRIARSLERGDITFGEARRLADLTKENSHEIVFGGRAQEAELLFQPPKPPPDYAEGFRARQILEFIRENPGSTARQVARYVKLTEVSIRSYLLRLVRLGAITREGAGAKSDPYRHYSGSGKETS